MKCEYKGKDGTCKKPAIMDCQFAEYLDGSSMEYCTLEENVDIKNSFRNKEEQIEQMLHDICDLKRICYNLLLYSLRLNQTGAHYDKMILSKVRKSDEPTTKATEYLRHMLGRIQEVENKHYLKRNTK